MLALLLLNANRVVPTSRLIDELWGDAPPETARKALQVYVSRLRKVLGPDGCTPAHAASGLRARRRRRALSTSTSFAVLRAAGACGARAPVKPPRPCAPHSRSGAGKPLAEPRRRSRSRSRAAAELEEQRLCDARRTDRRRPRAGPACRARLRAGEPRRRPSVPGAVSSPADARAVPVGPAGGRAGRVPEGARCLRREPRDRARAGAEGRSSGRCSTRTRPWTPPVSAAAAPPAGRPRRRRVMDGCPPRRARRRDGGRGCRAARRVGAAARAAELRRRDRPELEPGRRDDLPSEPGRGRSPPGPGRSGRETWMTSRSRGSTQRRSARQRRRRSRRLRPEWR